MPAVKPIPDDYPTVTAALSIDGAAQAITFYQQVFGATERMRIDDPARKVGHAELTIGDSVIMVADQYPEMNFLGPKAIGGRQSPSTSTSKMPTRPSPARSSTVPPRCDQSRTSSTVIAPDSSRTRSGTAGTSRPTSRMSHPKRWLAAPR